MWANPGFGGNKFGQITFVCLDKSYSGSFITILVFFHCILGQALSATSMPGGLKPTYHDIGNVNLHFLLMQPPYLRVDLLVIFKVLQVQPFSLAPSVPNISMKNPVDEIHIFG